MSNLYIEHNNTRWYCLSIFYNRKGWLTLLRQLREFFLSHEGRLKNFHFRFSTLGGMRLDVIFTFYEENVNIQEIEALFLKFITTHPSSNEGCMDWVSHSIWMHYENNTLVWKKIHIPTILLEESSFKRSLKLITLLGMELSQQVEDIENIPLFLLVRLLKHPISQRIDIFSQFPFQESYAHLKGLKELDTYLYYQAPNHRLHQLLEKWDDCNEKLYNVFPQEKFFLDMYIAIREQYAASEGMNELLSQILRSYFYLKIKEQPK